MIELKRKAVFYGPNPFVLDPVFVAELSVALPLEARAAEILADIRALAREAGKMGVPLANAATDAVLWHRSVEHAVILTGTGHMRSTGLPVDRVERTFLCDAGLPGEWWAVLSACTDEPVRFAPSQSAGDVLRILAGIAGAGGTHQVV